MPALFVLLPHPMQPGDLLRTAPSALTAAAVRLRVRLYPDVADSSELLRLVLAIRDPAAVQRGRIAAGSLTAGAATGAIGTWIAMFDADAGVLAAAVPIGAATGMALASTRMWNTRDSVRVRVAVLIESWRPGDRLCSWSGRDGHSLDELQQHCGARGLAAVRCE